MNGMPKIFYASLLLIIASLQVSCSFLGINKIERSLDDVELQSSEYTQCFSDVASQFPSLDSTLAQYMPGYIPFEEEHPTDYWVPGFNDRELAYYRRLIEYINREYRDQSPQVTAIITGYVEERQDYIDQACADSKSSLGDAINNAFKMGATQEQVKGASDLGSRKIIR